MFNNFQNNISGLEKEIEVLFFGRASCEASSKALNYLTSLGFKVTSILSSGRDELIPEDIVSWSGDYIFCFRSMIILPKSIIHKAKVAAINFHPGSPEYPGSGCLNYALYENSMLFGVTSHLMTEKVDEGSIIKCYRFPIYGSDTVNSLLGRTHLKLLELFFDVISGISINGKNYLNESIKNSKNEKWTGVKRKIKDINNLSIIDKNIAENEMLKLIRAVHTENYPLKIVLHGYDFLLKLNKT